MAKPTRDIPEFWKRQVRELAKLARDQGWRFDTTGKNHPRFWPPVGSGLGPERFSSSPSDVRAWTNFVKALERKGLVLPGGGRKGRR